MPDDPRTLSPDVLLERYRTLLLYTPRGRADRRQTLLGLRALREEILCRLRQVPMPDTPETTAAEYRVGRRIFRRLRPDPYDD